MLRAANSPSNFADRATPFENFSSAPADASAVSFAGVAPLTMKLAPGSAWNAATSVGSLTQSWAQAARPRNVRTEFGVTSVARSKRAPSSLRVSEAVRP
ncbi:hypothetical protein ABID60_005976 [Bradyrhizobium sp. S3.5.5]